MANPDATVGTGKKRTDDPIAGGAFNINQVKTAREGEYEAPIPTSKRPGRPTKH